MNTRTMAAVCVVAIVVALAASYFLLSPGEEEDDDRQGPLDKKTLSVYPRTTDFDLYCNGDLLHFGDDIELPSSGSITIRIDAKIPGGWWTKIDDDHVEYTIDGFPMTATYIVTSNIRGDTGHTLSANYLGASIEITFDGTRNVFFDLTQENT